MKSILKTLSLLLVGVTSLILMLTFSSCTDIVETDDELQPYFDLFAAEALERGITVNYLEERIEGLIQNVTETSVLGQCFRNVDRPKKGIVDRDYWEDASELEREFLIFHELGHCFLNLEHDDRVDPDSGMCVSIMKSTIDICELAFNDDTKEAYFDELFSK